MNFFQPLISLLNNIKNDLWIFRGHLRLILWNLNAQLLRYLYHALISIRRSYKNKSPCILRNSLIVIVCLFEQILTQLAQPIGFGQNIRVMVDHILQFFLQLKNIPFFKNFCLNKHKVINSIFILSDKPLMLIDSRNKRLSLSHFNLHKSVL